MARALSITNLYDKRFKTFDFDGDFEIVMDKPETSGIWIIYGAEKQGKTWFALQLANYLSTMARVLYVSAEEGVSMAFVDSCQRVGVDSKNRMLKFKEYTPVDEIDEYISKKNTSDVIFFDNMTIYSDEFKNGIFRTFTEKHKNKLIVIIAHEERGEPYTATAKLARKLAKIIVHIKGLRAFVSGRCSGGTLNINEETAKIYFSEEE
jgi:hypothetical protein